MTYTKKFDVSGNTYELSSEIVEVLDTDVRSDTHVQGSGFISGSSNQYGGHISGASSVSSTISVTRNIWYRRADGSEGHWRADSDIPVRVGHRLRFFRLSGPRVVKWIGRNDKGVDQYQYCDRVLLGAQVVETSDYYRLDGYGSQGNLWAVQPEPSYFSSSVLFWGGFALVFFFGVGLLVLLYWAIRTLAVTSGSNYFGVSASQAAENIRPIREAIANELKIALATSHSVTAENLQGTAVPPLLQA